MGDVILTSPVIRCLKTRFPECELHFLVKSKFKEAIENNPHISKFHFIEDSPAELFQELKNENFDLVIDLQRNRKSTVHGKRLGKIYTTFPKLNFKKFLLTTFKINRLPDLHVVDRYFKAVEKFGVRNDNLGLDFPLRKTDPPEVNNYIAIVLGATYYTKRIPIEKLIEIISGLQSPVVLLGGKAEIAIAEELTKKFPQVINVVGKTSLQESANYIQHAKSIITSDTGLMHIAAALNKKTITIWGNTVPAFGMSAYIPQHPENKIDCEVKDLSCRPCSKLGHQSCPKKHFKCMMQQDAAAIARLAE